MIGRLCGVALAAILGVLLLTGATTASPAGTESAYVILYKQQSVPSDAAAVVERAGGRVIASYPEIGVTIARSASARFAGALEQDTRVAGAVSTRGFGTRLPSLSFENVDVAAAPAPASTFEPFAALQWDMRQIRVPEAHAITTGSPSVLVGDIDSGVDWTHPDLAPNLDFAASASCESGAPDQDPAAWFDTNGHGTHTAGTIAAAVNGIGIAGVAPDVRIAAIKSGNDDGFLFPEMVICSFMWAAAQGMDVTNNSYFMDPWYFTCRNDPEQRTIWKAVHRAIRHAQKEGVTVVAAAGNFADDLAHPTRDIISPDTDPAAEPRDVSNACVVIPVEIPGTIGVSATGPEVRKTYYSSFGVGVVDVTAPGGDFLQATADAPTGEVLSTVPFDFGAFFEPLFPDLVKKDCSVTPCAYYAYFSGTSMAAPHVTGVVALIASRYGRMPTGRMATLIERSADALACPPNPYLWPDFPQFSNGEPQVCQGGRVNGFYGHGLVNALSAVSR